MERPITVASETVEKGTLRRKTEEKKKTNCKINKTRTGGNVMAFN